MLSWEVRRDSRRGTFTSSSLKSFSAARRLRSPLREGGSAQETAAMLRVIGRRFIPNLVLRYTEDNSLAVEARVCAAGACRPPVDGTGGAGQFAG